MSLRSKVALMLFTAVTLFVGADYVLRSLIFAERFRELDRIRAVEVLERVEAALQEQANDLHHAGRDLVAHLGDLGEGWGADAARVDAPPVTLGGEPLHLVVVYDADGQVYFQRVLDPRSGEPTTLRKLPNERLSPVHPLLRGWEDRLELRGLWVTEHGAILLSVDEIDGPAGRTTYLAIGRFVDEDMLADIEVLSGTQVQASLVRGSVLTRRQEDLVAQVAASQGPVIEENEEGSLLAWTVVPDLGEHPALLLRVDVAQQLADVFSQLSEYALTSALAVAVLIPFVILLLLQSLVTGPLSQLTEHAVAIGQGNDTDRRLNLQRRDEIGMLGDEFDGMLEKLARSREEVVRNARLAGMSQVSAGVIHNVGNVLNSVNISSYSVRRKVQDLGLDHLRAIVAALDEHAEDLGAYLTHDDRGRHLLPFFREVVDGVEAGAQVACDELDTLEHGVDHIVTLISALSSAAGRVKMVERLDLAQQVDAAMELSLRSLEDLSVTVERAYEALPFVVIDRHRLLEILVNVIRNALQALEAAAVENKQVNLRLARDGDEFVRIEVSDNGIGIPSEGLVQVFAMGHTTKSEGSGLGLHVAATTAGEMGGELTARSEGPGCGATFILRLPLRLE